MQKSTADIDGRNCIIYGTQKPEYILIQPVDERDMAGLDEEATHLCGESGGKILLVSFPVKDWNAELSPWKAGAVLGDEGFAGNADKTLIFVIKELVPFIRLQYEVGQDVKWSIGGYSLAGLFALYCAYRTDHFSAVAGISPSVWFPGWIEFVRENSPLTKAVYLSLGDKEEKTRNPVMSKVGDNIREMADIYAHSSNISRVTLEWNEGNHFNEPGKRIVKGFTGLCRFMSSI